MEARLLSFGRLQVDGREFDYDVVIDGAAIRKRKKGPSKPLRDRYGHTPLTLGEEIPWSSGVLVIGTGAHGQLPVTDEIYDEAERRGVRIIAQPTAEACRFLTDLAADDVAAILHVTC